MLDVVEWVAFSCQRVVQHLPGLWTGFLRARSQARQMLRSSRVSVSFVFMAGRKWRVLKGDCLASGALGFQFLFSHRPLTGRVALNLTWPCSQVSHVAQTLFWSVGRAVLTGTTCHPSLLGGWGPHLCPLLVLCWHHREALCLGDGDQGLLLALTQPAPCVWWEAGLGSHPVSGTHVALTRQPAPPASYRGVTSGGSETASRRGQGVPHPCVQRRVWSVVPAPMAVLWRAGSICHN